MAQLRQDYDRFTALGAVILVVGPERAEVFKKYWAKENLPFIGLPDPKIKVLKLYGQELNWFKMGRMPAQVMVDRSGIARFAHYGDAMSDIPANEELFELLATLNGN